MLLKVKKSLLFTRLVVFSIGMYTEHIRRTIAASKRSKQLAKQQNSADGSHEPKLRNIVVVGASFAGYHAARLIAVGLPPESPYRVVVIEPNSHFQFTWVLPRFCVVEGHEHKAFIPYGPYLTGTTSEALRWVTDRVASVSKTTVRLEESGEEIPYDYLVIATGSGAGDQLPSRVGSTVKNDGLERLRGIQQKVKTAQKIVVVGGGAAGVELATDAKNKYPEKNVTLVHSRGAVMHRFGPELQEISLKGLQDLGVEVILEERVVEEDDGKKTATLKSGRTLSFDYLVSSCFVQVQFEL
jgi:apoptosis-inducing factor 2